MGFESFQILFKVVWNLFQFNATIPQKISSYLKTHTQMKSFLTSYLFLLLGTQLSFSQQKLKVIDISQKQLLLMQQYQKMDSLRRSQAIIKTLYTPYKQFWNGYLGEADDVASWLDGAMSKLPDWKVKNTKIDGQKLALQLNKFAKDMKVLTGYEPQGDWYIVYGPAWTDLGSLGYAMLIDLAHKSNISNEKIAMMFPHELTHQIMSNVNKNKDTTAISSIIGEGFAVWMNQKYWKQKYTLAQHLGYTEEELKTAGSYLDKLKGFLDKNKYATDRDMIDVFRNRSSKLNEKLPGAIGYYLGYLIVDEYVKKHGIDSWKNIFVKPPKEILKESGFIELKSK